MMAEAVSTKSPGMKRLLIVGSGLSGTSLAYLLSRTARPDLLETRLWDKARSVGGRMHTVRSNRVPGCHVDLGSQYYSVTPEYARIHAEEIGLLTAADVLAPLEQLPENQREYPAGTAHYVAPSGAYTIPRLFLERSGAPVDLNRQVSRVDLLAERGQWSVTAQDGSEALADALVLTAPVPQLLALKGDLARLLSEEDLERLRRVQYSSRYALGLFYDHDTHLLGDWTSTYVDNNPVLRFVSKDHRKRGRDEDAASVVVHSSVPFGLQCLEAPTSVVQSKMIAELKAHFSDSLPEPAELRLHKWRYSQVYRAFDGRPGCLVAHADPPLILAGDAFSHSNLSGVLTSAKAARDQLLRLLPGVAAH